MPATRRSGSLTSTPGGPSVRDECPGWSVPGSEASVAVTTNDDGESRARDTAIQHAGEQGLLFDDEALAVHSDDVGYRGPTACAAAGIT